MAEPAYPSSPIITAYRQVEPFITRDGTWVRELMHPAVHGNLSQSLAEATLAPRQESVLHRHHSSEELYHVTEGEGEMTLGGERFPVRPGDSVCIPPGTPHCIRNTGAVELRILCCCAPPYADQDTELLAE